MKKLLWIDLEMTGLDDQRDVILEVAAVVTDLDFKSLDGYFKSLELRAVHLRHRREEYQAHGRALGKP